MQKKELVHLHGLLVEIARFLVDQGEISADIWNEYEALDINAFAIHAKKSDHEEAVLLLATGLGRELERSTDEQSAISAR